MPNTRARRNCRAPPPARGQDRGAGRGRGRDAQDAPPWGLPSRSDPCRRRRCDPDRLRGRALQAACATSGQRAVRCATWPGCCAPSTMPPRRSHASLRRRVCRRRTVATSCSGTSSRWLRPSFLEGYRTDGSSGRAQMGSRSPVRDGADRALPDREGGLRDRLRGGQPTGLDRHSAAGPDDAGQAAAGAPAREGRGRCVIGGR